MNDNNPQPPANKHRDDPSVYLPQRPTPAQDPTDSQTTEVLRDKIHTIYQQSPPNQLQQSGQSPYKRTYNNGEYNWQHYHTAWQQYYQQYYQHYYLQQLHLQRQQQAAEKAKEAAKPTKQHEANFATDASKSLQIENLRKTQVATLKDDLLGKIKNRAKKARRSSHFWPVVSALTVGGVFLFLQYNRFLAAEVQAYVSPGSNINESDTVLVDPTANLNVGPEPKLIIPKINVNIRTVYDVTSLEDAPVQEGLKRGVVHYKLPGANSVPGEVGNSVFLGHSSNDIFDPGDYKFAFVLLDRLQEGDVFYTHYQSTRYMYRVTGKKVIKPTELNALQIKTDKPLATLVTCTPLGTATNRLLVTGEQISPDPALAKKSSSGNASDSSAALPGNSPTFLERIRDFFF